MAEYLPVIKTWGHWPQPQPTGCLCRGAPTRYPTLTTPCPLLAHAAERRQSSEVPGGPRLSFPIVDCPGQERRGFPGFLSSFLEQRDYDSALLCPLTLPLPFRPGPAPSFSSARWTLWPGPTPHPLGSPRPCSSCYRFNRI